MNSNFSELGVSAPILKALDEMGFETPTEVQSKAIPHILNNEDIIVRSKTGSGKTAVFGVSMLQMTDPEAKGIQGLILTPTRELAVQIDSDIKKMGKYLPHKTTAVYGQHSMNVELQALNKGASIVTGTPGRVFDHISHNSLDTRNVRFLVLDEADRMLDMGFLDQVIRIIKTLPRDRMTLLFSATIPDEIHRICSYYMKPSVTTIEIESQTKTVDTIKQAYYRANYNEKNTQLNRLLLIERPESCMIFCNTRIAVDRVQSFLTRKGYASEALHGDIPQAKRMKTLQQFKQGDFHILVATDVAARGIHIDDLSLVINYDVPVEKDSYVHRIGRTGRAGNEGRAITLVTSDDIMSLYEIEEHIGAMIEEAELPAETMLNEHKEEADKWIQANARKVKPQKDVSESGTKEPQKRRTHTGPQQPDKPHARPDNERRRERPAEAGKDGRDYKEHKDSRYGKDSRVAKDNRDIRDSRDTRDNRDNRINRDTRDNKDNRVNRDIRDNKNSKDYRSNRDNNSTTKNTRPPYSQKPARPAQAGMTPAAAATKPSVNSQGAGNVQNQAAASKPSFFKRLMNKILGK